MKLQLSVEVNDEWRRAIEWVNAGKPMTNAEISKRLADEIMQWRDNLIATKDALDRWEKFSNG